MKSLQKYKLTFLPLTPCHIGTKQKYDFFVYIIKNNVFYHININNILTDLSKEELQEFNNLCDDNNVIDLRNFIVAKFDSNPDKYTLFYSQTTNNIQNLYTNKFNNCYKQLKIHACQHSPLSQKPLFPGSSIKGAIRTAWLAKLAKDNHLRSNEFEETLLTNDNIFKFINISDTEFPANTTRIHYVYNRPRHAYYNKERDKTPSFAVEFLSSVLSINTSNDIELIENTPTADSFFYVKNKTDAKNIFDACNNYFTKILLDSKIYWDNFRLANYYNHLLNMINKDNNSFLLRCGEFSGKETYCVPEVMKGRTPKCINLVDDSLFTGWIKVDWEQIT